MSSHWTSGRPLHRRVHASFAVLAILLFAFTTMAAAWHNEAPDRDCPICQVANFLSIKPAEGVQLAPPTVIERQAAVSESLQEQNVPLISCPPRAPPA